MSEKSTPLSAQRAAIRDVAVKLFSEHGYTGTTMRDIAQAVGVLPGSLYAHIDSKETLLVDIVQSGIQRFLEIERSLKKSNLPPAEKLRLAMRGHITVVAADPRLMMIVFHQWRYLGEPGRTNAIAMRRRYANTFKDVLKEGIARGDFRPDLDVKIVMFSILGALNWTPEWYSPLGPMKAIEIADKMAQVIIDGAGVGSGKALKSPTRGKSARLAARR